MNMIKIFFFTLALVLVSCHKSIDYSEQDHIINLGMPSWDRASKDFDRGLFMYLSHPLCTPCKLPFEEFKLAAADLFEFQSGVQFAKVNCHDENGLCEFLHIDEYPTLLLYRAEKPFIEYRGVKKSQNITTWIKKVIDGQYEQFYDEKALFNRFSTALVISTQFPEEINLAYRSLVDDIQISLRDFPESAKLPVLHVRDTGYILIQGKAEERFKIDETHNADWLKARFKSILYEEKVAVPNFIPMHWKMLQSEQGHNFVFFFRTEKFDATSDATKSFDKVAMDESDDNLLFTYVNVDEVLGDTVAKWFGVVNSDEPTVGILSKQGNVLIKYKLRTQITEKSIKDLIKNYENDDERYYISAPIPKAKENDIQELVGSNFKTVTGSGKNVLVLFYFHRTVFSAQYDYIWKTLSYRFRKNPNLIIARIDMSQNDVEGVELQEYPVVRLYRSNSNYTDYPSSLPIELKGIKDFLIENVPGIRTEIEL